MSTSQARPLWSERKCQTLGRVFLQPQEQRVILDGVVSESAGPLRGTPGDCPGTPVFYALSMTCQSL